MSKISVIYRAPAGDSKVCEMYGHTFFDGKPTEIEDAPENADTIKSLSNHSLFEVSGKSKYAAAGPQPAPKPEPAPGTPPPQPQPEDGEEEDGDADATAEDDEPPFEDYKPRKKAAARVK